MKKRSSPALFLDDPASKVYFFVMFRRRMGFALSNLEIFGLFFLLWGIFLYMGGLVGGLEIESLARSLLFWSFPLFFALTGVSIQIALTTRILEKWRENPREILRKALFRIVSGFLLLLIIGVGGGTALISFLLRVSRSQREIFLIVSSGLVCFLLAFVMGLPSLAKTLLSLPEARGIHGGVRLRFLYLNAALVSAGMLFLILLTFLFSKRSLEPGVHRNLMNNVRSVSSLTESIYQDLSKEPAFHSLKKSEKGRLVFVLLKEKLDRMSSGNAIRPFVMSASGKILYIGGLNSVPQRVIDPVTGKTLAQSIFSEEGGGFEYFWPEGGRGKRVIIRYLFYPKLAWYVGVVAPWKLIWEPVLGFSEKMFFLAGIFVLAILAVTFFTVRGPLAVLDGVLERLTEGPVVAPLRTEEITKSLDDLLYRLRFQEEAVALYAQRLYYLYREAMKFAEVEEEDSFRKTVLRGGRRAFEGDYAFLFPYDESKEALEVQLVGPEEKELQVEVRMGQEPFWKDVRDKDSPMVWEGKEPLEVGERIRISPPWKALSAPLLPYGKKRWILLVLREGKGFLKEDVLLFGTLASLAGMVYERLSYLANLETEVEERTRELRELQKELEKANILLRDQAIRDPLTGVYNRRFMDEVFENPVKGFPEVSLILLDLDGFKEINDSHGHKVGDYVLKAVARTLQNRLRVEDHVFRYGGDEFIIYLPGVGRDAVHRVAERLREALEKERYLFRSKEREIELHLTASFGVVTLGGSEAELLRKGVIEADKTMYQAKKEGKNKIKVANSPLGEDEERTKGESA